MAGGLRFYSSQILRIGSLERTSGRRETIRVISLRKGFEAWHASCTSTHGLTGVDAMTDENIDTSDIPLSARASSRRRSCGCHTRSRRSRSVLIPLSSTGSRRKGRAIRPGSTPSSAGTLRHRSSAADAQPWAETSFAPTRAKGVPRSKPRAPVTRSPATPTAARPPIRGTAGRR